MSSKRALHPAFVVTVSTLSLGSACTSTSGCVETSQRPPTGQTPVPTVTATATTTDEPIHEDPPPPVAYEEDPKKFDVRQPEGRVDWDAYPTTVNPRTPERKMIYRAKDSCFYHGELKETPRSWVPLPREPVACPEIMRRPEWSACLGGTLKANEAGDTCLCAMDGNPPPPAHLQSCPKE